MLNETPSAFGRIITSLKVAALVIVLGTVVIAADHRLVSTGQTLAAATSHVVVQGDSAQPALFDYFPAHFPAPQGEPAEPVPTF